jgi:hypothetical protein
MEGSGTISEVAITERPKRARPLSSNDLCALCCLGAQQMLFISGGIRYLKVYGGRKENSDGPQRSERTQRCEDLQEVVFVFAFWGRNSAVKSFPSPGILGPSNFPPSGFLHPLREKVEGISTWKGLSNG